MEKVVKSCGTYLIEYGSYEWVYLLSHALAWSGVNSLAALIYITEANP